MSLLFSFPIRACVTSGKPLNEETPRPPRPRKMGMKIIDEFWTMGAYDAVVVVDAPNDETISAFMLKIGSLGNVKSHTMRAFLREEMEGILAKIK